MKTGAHSIHGPNGRALLPFDPLVRPAMLAPHRLCIGKAPANW